MKTSVNIPETTVSKPQTGKPYLAELPPNLFHVKSTAPAKIDSKKPEVREPANQRRSRPRRAEELFIIEFIHIYQEFTEEEAIGARGMDLPGQHYLGAH